MDRAEREKLDRLVETMVADRERFTLKERIAIENLNSPWQHRHRLKPFRRGILNGIYQRRIIERKRAHPQAARGLLERIGRGMNSAAG